MIKNFIVHQRTKSDEDADPIATNQMIIVCDGLGATGLSHHVIDGEDRTSAYVGSRQVSRIAKTFFEKLNEEMNTYIEDDAESLRNRMVAFKTHLNESLISFVESNHLEKSMRGKSIALLPTTLAMAVFKEKEETIDVLTVWAGDSRVYLLTAEEGLQQITCDDVSEHFDAMIGLGTSNMSNCITGDEGDSFWVNYKKFEIPKRKNLFIMAMSDGCFDCLPTPMHLELSLESAIMNCSDNVEFDKLGDAIASNYVGANLHDDTSIAAVGFDVSNFAEMKKQYRERYQFIKQTYQDKTFDCLKIRANLQMQINQKLAKLNIAIRDLKKEMVPYMIGVVNQCYEEGTPEIELQESILELPCMKNYQIDKNLTDEIELEKERVKEKQKQLGDYEDQLKNVFIDDYCNWQVKEETRKDYVDQAKIGFQKMSKIGELMGFKSEKRESEDFFEEIKTCFLEFFNRVNQEAFTPQNLSHLLMENPPFSPDLAHQYYIIIKEKEKTELSLKERKKEFVAQAEMFYKEDRYKEYLNGEDFDQTTEIDCKIQHCRQRIEKGKRKIEEIKQKQDCTRYVNSLGNRPVIEFSQIINNEVYLPESLVVKIKNYRLFNNEQEEWKQQYQKVQDDLVELWKKTYKSNYEFYEKAVYGGRI